MDKFSVFNYENLSEELKAGFNKALAQKLSFLVDEIKHDDVLDSLNVEEFVASSGISTGAASMVAELYSRIAGSIQVGSGNQKLFQIVLRAITECWNDINKKQ